ncbi:MAG: porphobilinogen synthase [Planctomycetes bacterium]|nr:porphobilinogen synthase [Planctomycetota bacterium]
MNGFGFPTRRMRRLRMHATLREMLAEVRLDRMDLIAPLFVREGEGIRRPIAALPGQFQLSPDTAAETARRWSDLGLRAVLLFGIPKCKDAAGSGAWDPAGVVPQAVAQIKRAAPEMVVITDVCLCEYTNHGHCGPITTGADGARTVDNDAALLSLARVAVAHARSGADVVAPSDMMDGRVAAIRSALDDQGLIHTPIMSYAVKFASQLYAPFREAAEGSLRFGDRRSHQMDFRAPRQVRPEVMLDLQEGADIVMVKPAATYLDVIQTVRAACDAPLAAYHVSGEYGMLVAAVQLGFLEERAAVMEVTTAIKRAGADLIITYFAEKLAGWL